MQKSNIEFDAFDCRDSFTCARFALLVLLHSSTARSGPQLRSASAADSASGDSQQMDASLRLLDSEVAILEHRTMRRKRLLTGDKCDELAREIPNAGSVIDRNTSGLRCKSLDSRPLLVTRACEAPLLRNRITSERPCSLASKSKRKQGIRALWLLSASKVMTQRAPSFSPLGCCRERVFGAHWTQHMTCGKFVRRRGAWLWAAHPSPPAPSLPSTDDADARAFPGVWQHNGAGPLGLRRKQS